MTFLFPKNKKAKILRSQRILSKDLYMILFYPITRTMKLLVQESGSEHIRKIKKRFSRLSILTTTARGLQVEIKKLI